MCGFVDIYIKKNYLQTQNSAEEQIPKCQQWQSCIDLVLILQVVFAFLVILVRIFKVCTIICNALIIIRKRVFIKLICWCRTLITERDYTLAFRSVDGFRHQDRKHWLPGELFPFGKLLLSLHLKHVDTIMAWMELTQISTHSLWLHGWNKVGTDG